MAHLIAKELECNKDTFIVDHVIESLTYKSTNGKVGQAEFNPLQLENVFQETIDDLQKINETTRKRIDKLESECAQEKLKCKDKLNNIEQSYKESYETLNQLDKRINEVSSKMSEMGAQLDALNKPNKNLNESYKMAKYYDKFMEGIDTSGVFANDNKLDLAADLIYKLSLLTSDLNDIKFERANRLIQQKYEEIEKKLIQRFHASFYANDKKQMKKCILILSNFNKGYHVCIQEFIKNSQANLLTSTKDIFNDMWPLCQRTNEIINDVFTNNEKIMEQFIKDLFLGKVSLFICTNTKDLRENDLDKYLDTIYIYYNKTKNIFNKLADLMKLPNESTFFTKLLNEIFQIHLKDYQNLEKTNVTNKFKDLLDRLYEDLNHTKRNFQSMGLITNLLQKSTGTSYTTTNEQIDDRFLSNDLTAICIDTAKKALNRIQLLNNNDLNIQLKMIEEISDLVTHTLVKEHFQYAIDIHTHAIQSVDFKQAELSIRLFDTIKKLNNLMYLYDNFMNRNVLPLLNGTIQYTNVLSKQKQQMIDLETKIDLSLERVFTLVCNHIKHILTAEQKSSDFKVDESLLINLQLLTVCTPTCSKILRIIQNYLDQINESFDGKNLNNILKEFGIKYHRCIYEHIIKYEYNELGAMSLIRDLNEYRQFAKNFNSPLLETLFVTLYSLANLLVVAPNNLQEICSGDSLISINKDIIESFVKLRSDYKNLKFQINRLNRA